MGNAQGRVEALLTGSSDSVGEVVATSLLKNGKEEVLGKIVQLTRGEPGNFQLSLINFKLPPGAHRYHVLHTFHLESTREVKQGDGAFWLYSPTESRLTL